MRNSAHSRSVAIAACLTASLDLDLEQAPWEFPADRLANASSYQAGSFVADALGRASAQAVVGPWEVSSGLLADRLCDLNQRTCIVIANRQCVKRAPGCADDDEWAGVDLIRP